MTAAQLPLALALPDRGSALETVGAADTPRPTPRVLGLDLSLTSTGLAGPGWAETLKPPTKLRGHDRLAYIRGAIVDRYVVGVDLVVVEGPSYGSPQAAQRGHHERAGLWWLITHALWARGTRVAIVPPSSLKRYATGKGTAGKDDIMREVARRFPWFEGDNNAADALILAALGADWLGAPIVVMPQTHRAALSGCDWPGAATC